MSLIALLLGAYLLGSIPFAVVTSKLLGLEIRAATARATRERPMCCAAATRALRR